MVSLSNLLFYVSLIFTHFFTLSTLAELERQYHECYKSDKKYTTNSIYHTNLNFLLDSISTKTGTTPGFYNFSYGEDPNKIYAFGICRPDMDADNCRSCITVASQNMTSICPNSRQGIAGFDDRGSNNCMLRYADYPIFDLMENKPYFFVHNDMNITENLIEFNQTRKRLLERLASGAAVRALPYKYAVGEQSIEGISRVYALVQCNPYISEDNCKSCLNDSITLIQECCDKNNDGRVITPSCNFRYAPNKFYNSSIEVYPPPLSPPPPPHPGKI